MLYLKKIKHRAASYNALLFRSTKEHKVEKEGEDEGKNMNRSCLWEVGELQSW